MPTKSARSRNIPKQKRRQKCIIYLTEAEKYITFKDENKNEVKFLLNKVDDIYNYSEQLIKAAKSFIKE